MTTLAKISNKYSITLLIFHETYGAIQRLVCEITAPDFNMVVLRRSQKSAILGFFRHYESTPRETSEVLIFKMAAPMTYM